MDTNVLADGQCAAGRLRSDSSRAAPRLTPYMIANHMIAAGVEGRCGVPAVDVRRFEAQDLAAASFLKQLADDPAMTPTQAGVNANLEWFGNADGSGMRILRPTKRGLSASTRRSICSSTARRFTVGIKPPNAVTR